MDPLPLPDREAALAAFETAFEAGRYFDAHEILEAYWVAYRGHDRDLYRGLIQAAVAMHHAKTGNPAGARRVGARARSNLEPYAPSHDGIDVARYLLAIERTTPWP